MLKIRGFHQLSPLHTNTNTRNWGFKLQLFQFKAPSIKNQKCLPQLDSTQTSYNFKLILILKSVWKKGYQSIRFNFQSLKAHFARKTPKRGLSHKHGQNYAQMVQNATDVEKETKKNVLSIRSIWGAAGWHGGQQGGQHGWHKGEGNKEKGFFCFERALDPLNLRSSRLRKSLRQNKSGGGGGKVFRSKSRQYKSSLRFHVFVSITERSHHEKISVVD